MGKTLIKVECVDQRLLVSSGPIIASGGKNEDEIEFGFCPLWDEFEKTAVFYREKDRAYHAIIVDNRCVIPHEVLIDEGWLYFGVMGVKGDITRTSEIMKYRVAEGAITEGTKPSDPTPDIYEQILNQLSATNKRLDQMGGSSLEPQPFEVTGNMVQLDNYSGMPMHCVTHIEPVQAGSGDPSPSNVRPISGFTGAKLTKCGKNLVQYTIPESAFGITANSIDHGFKLVGTATNGYNKPVYDSNQSIKSGTYTLSVQLNGSVTGRGGINIYFSANGKMYSVWKNGTLSGVFSHTFTLPEDVYSWSIRVACDTGSTYDISVSHIQLEVGTTATAYEPYQGETFSVNFGQTVYGGTLDWNKGVLTVDRVLKTLSESDGYGITGNWPAGLFRINVADAFPVAGYATVSDVVCSHAPATTPNDLVSSAGLIGIAQGNNTQIFFRFSADIATVGDMATYAAAQIAAGTPVQIIYKLATPTTIQLTPARITAIQGINNIWCDAGETTVSGRKDILWLTNDLINQIAELRAAIISLGGNV